MKEIDFKNLSIEQEDGLKKLIIAMQQTSLDDLNHLKENGAQILTSGSEETSKSENEFPLDFKNLDEATTKSLSSMIIVLQESLIKDLRAEKEDPNEKHILLSTPDGGKNLSTNEVIKEVEDITSIGLWFLQLHWETINSSFNIKTKPEKKFWDKLKFW